MTDNEPDNLILRHLREIDRKLDLMRGDLTDVKLRLSALEGAVATAATQIAVTNSRLDRVDARLDRIERRLDLVETP